MNGERLYINGKQVELKSNGTFAYTLQVNDISSVDDRQASLTKTIKLPKSPINTEIMEYLGVVGNKSILPYQKLKVNYYINNDCVIYEGWGTVTETNENDYLLNVYDGVIDLYKAIENKNLSILDLSDLVHDKTLSAVTSSWINNLNYKYIIADYNGKLKYDTNKINIDYQVPSVKVSYLFDKIFEKFNMTYQGDIFQSDDFQNLWMTYPKGDGVTTTPEIPLYESDDLYFSNGNPVNPTQAQQALLLLQGSNSINTLASISNNAHFKVGTAGNYRIRINGEILSRYSNFYTTITEIWMGKNSEWIHSPFGFSAGNVTPVELLQTDITVNGTSTVLNINKIVTLNANDSVCFIIKVKYPSGVNYVLNIVDEYQPISLKISPVINQSIDFGEVLSDFKITDFLKEITWRYGLTIFKDKYTQNYQFLTLNERLNLADKVDWSDKFQSIKSEKYIYGNYAQNNILHHKYNDDKSNYNDGVLNIFNQNLTDENTVIQSVIYSPENELNTADLPFNSHIYKLWDKEVSENNGVQEVKYKSLDKRYYFLKSNDITFSGLTVGSEGLLESTTVTTMPIETYSGIPYKEIVNNYYSEIGDIISNCKIITAKIRLTETDISTFDFKKLYHIYQLGGYFIVNKINNWQPNKITDVELIKVENGVIEQAVTGTTGTITEYINISGITFTNADAWTRTINVHFDTNITTPYLKVVFTDSPTTPVTILNQSPYSFLDIVNPLGGFYSLNLTSMDGSIISNPTSWWG